jgi:tetrapyrrole methylase family protein/MazG family protein
MQRVLGALGSPGPDDTRVVDALDASTGTAAYSGLERIVSILRSPVGCPWDRAQTVDSLLPQLHEELAEFQEAWAHKAADDQAEELGDVLLHIVMIAQIAAEAGAFDASDVIRSISAKMVRRHPHVFGDVKIDDVDDVYALWDAIKEREKAARDR